MQALEQNTQWVCESRRKAPSPEAVTRSGVKLHPPAPFEGGMGDAVEKFTKM